MVSKLSGQFQNCLDISRRLQNLPDCFKTVRIFPDSHKTFWTVSKLSGSFHMISKSSSRSQIEETLPDYFKLSRLFQNCLAIYRLLKNLPDGLKTAFKTVRTLPDDFKTFFRVSELAKYLHNILILSGRFPNCAYFQMTLKISEKFQNSLKFED